MSYLILGGTGTVGSGVVRELLERGEGEIRVVTRSRENASELPDGVEPVVTDLTDPVSLEGAFDGARRLFLLNAVAMTELHEGLAALEEARRAGVRRIVYLSVHNPESGTHVPHFAAKVAMERALDESGIPHTVIQPNNFYQNDFWLKEVISGHGVYPQPIGDRGIPRVDVRDVSHAAANALVSDEFDGGKYPVVGPEELTGEDCARVYSEVMGREIQYGGNDLAAWEEQARQSFPAWMAFDFRIMYQMFHEGGFTGTSEDLEATRKILGRDPIPFGDFVREFASDW